MQRILVTCLALLACHTSSYSFSFESNESKQKKWDEIISKQTEQGKACLNVGIQKFQLKVKSTDPNAETSSPSDTPAKEIFTTCDKFLAIPLRKDVSCNLKDGKKGLCSDRYCYEKDGKKWNSPGLGVGAMKAMFDGIPLTACLYENEDSKLQREAAAQAEKEAIEKAEAERIAEEKRQQEYMNSPAYKKEQQQIAKAKASEEKEAITSAKQKKWNKTAEKMALAWKNEDFIECKVADDIVSSKYKNPNSGDYKNSKDVLYGEEIVKEIKIENGQLTEQDFQKIYSSFSSKVTNGGVAASNRTNDWYDKSCQAKIWPIISSIASNFDFCDMKLNKDAINNIHSIAGNILGGKSKIKSCRSGFMGPTITNNDGSSFIIGQNPFYTEKQNKPQFAYILDSSKKPAACIVLINGAFHNKPEMVCEKYLENN